MAYKDVKFNDKEKEYLNKLIPLEIMKNVYNPIVSDGIKFNASYNGDYFNDNKFKFF